MGFCNNQPHRYTSLTSPVVIDPCGKHGHLVLKNGQSDKFASLDDLDILIEKHMDAEQARQCQMRATELDTEGFARTRSDVEPDLLSRLDFFNQSQGQEWNRNVDAHTFICLDGQRRPWVEPTCEVVLPRNDEGERGRGMTIGFPYFN